MSWSINKTGTREQVIEHARKSTAYRNATNTRENGNADQHDAARDFIIDAVQALPPKYNAAIVEAHGHVDDTNSANCEIKVKGLIIEFPAAPVPAAHEALEAVTKTEQTATAAAP